MADNENELVAWVDVEVQAVYQEICSSHEPVDDMSWESSISRKIVTVLRKHRAERLEKLSALMNHLFVECDMHEVFRKRIGAIYPAFLTEREIKFSKLITNLEEHYLTCDNEALYQLRRAKKAIDQQILHVLV